jgi:hypothetical protein
MPKPPVYPIDKNYTLSIAITSDACPLEIFGTVGGRPIWYRQRSNRWELYEATKRGLETAEKTGTLSVDANDHLSGPDVIWIATGTTQPNEDEGDLWAALAGLAMEDSSG